MTVQSALERPHRLARRVVAGHVDLITGACLDHALELVSAGPPQLCWVRGFDSRAAAAGVDRGLGPGQRHGYDRSLHLGEQTMTFIDHLGLPVTFPRFERDGERHRRAGVVIDRLEPARYRVSQRGQPTAELSFPDLRQPARLLSLVNGQGWVRLRYRSNGRLALIRASDGRQLELDWTGDHLTAVELLTAEGTAAGCIRYRYDAGGRLVASEAPGDRCFRYEYDAAGRLAQAVDPRGAATVFRHDEAGRCCAVARGDDLVEVEHFPEAEQAVVTRGDGRWIVTFSAAIGAVRHQLDPDGGSTSFEHDPDDGRTLSETDPSGARWTYEHDWTGAAIRKVTGGRVVPLVDGDEPEHATHHRVGTCALEWCLGDLFLPPDRLPDVYSLPLDLPAPVLAAVQRGEGVGPAASEVERDELGRVLGESYADGRSWRCGRDPFGAVLWLEDLEKSRYQAARDLRGRLVRLIDPLGAVTGVERDARGRISTVIDPRGARTRYRWDELDRLVAVTRDGGRCERYRYDQTGNVVERCDERGQPLVVTSFGPGGVPESRQLAAGETQRFEWDEATRLVRATSAAGEVELEYDRITGRRCRDQRDGAGVEHRFGRRGLRQTTVLDRFVTSYEQPDTDTLEVTDPTGAVHRIESLGFGLIRLTLSSGATAVSQYDRGGRCLLRAVDPGSGRWQVRRYERSGEGFLLRELDSERGGRRFLRDDAHRLAQVIGPDGEAAGYEHDAAGGLVRAPGLTAGFDPKTPGRLASINGQRVDLDERGRLRLQTGDGSMRWYHYDELDQLRQVKLSDGRRFEIDYDGLGRRVETRFDGERRRFFWDGDRLAAEQTDPPDGPLRVYVYPDAFALVPLLCLDYESKWSDPASGRRAFFFTDQLGCPVLVLDDEGRTLWRAEVEPCGAARVIRGEGVFHQPLRWPGHYHEDELGLQWARFRVYGPAAARFLQPNPLGLGGGLELTAAAPVDPLTEVDLLGLGAGRRIQRELRPDREEAADLEAVFEARLRRVGAATGLEAARDAAFAVVQTLRQRLNRDPELGERFDGDLRQLEGRWNHLLHSAADPALAAIAADELERLRQKAEELEERLRREGEDVEEEESVTHELTSRPWKRFAAGFLAPAGPPPMSADQ